MRVTVAAVLLGAVLGTGACYAYRPASLAPAPGARVRIVLVSSVDVSTFEPGSENMRRVHPAVMEASGTVRAAAGDTVVLTLGELRTAYGPLPGLAGQIALLPVSQVARIEERRFQAGATLATGLGLSLLALSTFVVVVIVAITKGF